MSDDKWTIHKCRRGHPHWHVNGPDPEGWDDREFATGAEALAYINRRLTRLTPDRDDADKIAEIRALAKSATEQDMFGAPAIHATRILAILDGNQQ